MKPVFKRFFASTCFVRDLSEIEQLNVNLKKIWEIGEASLASGIPIVKVQEKLALKTAEQSVTFDINMHRVGIPW